MSLQSYLQAVPKAELHVHLEGAIQPSTLLELARRNRVPLPADTVGGLKEWFTFRDFRHFVEIYTAISRCLRTSEDYELIVYEFGAEMARQNVRYAEVTFTPATHALLGVPEEAYLGGLKRGRERIKAEFGVELNWVFDIPRGVPDLSKRSEYADYTVRVAIEGMSEGVVALGLGGMEVGNPPELFERQFDKARAAGLRSTPHAGETVGPESVWGALNALGAERLGHGVRSIEDPKLVEFLVEKQIPLELNPTSNLCLKVYPTIGEHPLRRLYEAGVPMTVNSDDPPLFNTNLNAEVALLASAFGFEVDLIDEILLNGVRHSFLPSEKKQELEASFRSEMATLKAKHLHPADI
jgi:adenosine deaminase